MYAARVADSAGSRLDIPLPPHRLEAFSDGVFAIACTLLVLDLKVPELAAVVTSRGGLWGALAAQWPKLLAYLISFGIVGFYWVGHHLMMHFVRQVDRRFLFLNILFLLLVAFMPYPAAVLGTYGAERAATTLYGGTLTTIGLVYVALWRYASDHHRLVDPALPWPLIRRVSRVIAAAPVFYAAAVLVGFVSPRASMVVYLLVPLAYLVPGSVDRMVGSAAQAVSVPRERPHAPHPPSRRG